MPERVLITGDKHGAFDPFFRLAEKNELYESDILLITGDASYVWDKDYPHRLTTLQQLFPGTVAFIDGNHENHEILNSLEVSKWMGGNVHQVADRVYHLMRGEIFHIRGNKYFTLGGAKYAAMLDKQGKEGIDWWRGEYPSKGELEYALNNLLCNADSINYVLTHEAPISARAHVKKIKPVPEGYDLPFIYEDMYHVLAEKPNFKAWMFGHLHEDIKISNNLYGLHNAFYDIADMKKLRII